MFNFFRKVTYKVFRSRAARKKMFAENNALDFARSFPHDCMLADKSRMSVYHKAIKKYVREGDTVMDLGCGTGILSFLCAAQKTRKIYALDHSGVILAAQKIAAENKISGIEFVPKNSFDFSSSEKFDVIIHDQIGDLLFEENMLETLIDARERFLKKSGGRILPNKFELYIEPVKVKDAFHVPFLHDQKIEGIDFSSAAAHLTPKKIRDMWSDEIDFFFSAPSPVFCFDLETLERKDIPRVFTARKNILRSGRLDGFLLYFKIIFDDEITLLTDFSQPWLSWTRQLLRCPSREISAGKTLSFSLTAPEFQCPPGWSWDYTVSPAKTH